MSKSKHWLRIELDQLYCDSKGKSFVYLYNNEPEYKGCIRYCEMDCCPIDWEGTREHTDSIYVFFPRNANYISSEEHFEANKNSRMLVDFEYLQNSTTHECIYPIFKPEFKAVKLKAMKLLKKYKAHALDKKMKENKVDNVIALAEKMLKIPKKDLRWTSGEAESYPRDVIFFCVKRLCTLLE